MIRPPVPVTNSSKPQASGEALIPVVVKVGFLSIRRELTKDRIEALGIPEIVKSMKFGVGA